MKKSAIICKLFTVVIIAIAVLQLSACMKTVPTEKHSIPVPSDYPSAQDEYGADAFECSLDNSESGFYRINDYYNMEPTETLHIIDHFRTYQQTTEYTCGAASALMVLNYYGIDEYDEMLLAKLMKADETHGISVEGIRDFFVQLGWNVEAHADIDTKFDDVDSFQNYIIKKIDNGVPVIVDWVDWGGHWQVIIGVDTGKTDSPYDDVLILADPYDVTDHWQDGYYTFSLCRFFSMWEEGGCTANKMPYQQPYVIATPLQ